MSERIETVSFKTRRSVNLDRKARRERNLQKKSPIRAARLLALAHDIDRRIETGEFTDYADVAKKHGLTRARLTQIMNLLLLAPDIQEQILVMEAEPGREPVSARDLRKVGRSLVWREQRKIWNEFGSSPKRQDFHQSNAIQS